VSPTIYIIIMTVCATATRIDFFPTFSQYAFLVIVTGARLGGVIADYIRHRLMKKSTFVALVSMKNTALNRIICRRHLCAVAGLLAGCSTLSPPTVPSCPVAPTYDVTRLAKIKQRDRGVLWEVSKDGRSAFLYGTVHVAKPKWDFPGPTIRTALSSSNALAVELDVTDPTLGARLQRERSMKKEQDGSLQLFAESSVLAARASEQFRLACLDEAKLGDATLASKVDLLPAFSARDAGLYPDFMIDASLIGFARATKKPVIALETSLEQVEALEQDNASIEADLVSLERGDTRTQIVKLATAWANRDLAEIESLFPWCNCAQDPPLISRLIHRRNIVLAERIAHLYETQDGVFAAIGILHMIGPGSVLERLRGMGYSVRQLTAPVGVK
jgi:uncharacterized protein